ncbi:hypothetical protein F5888DRAFT_1805539 [Russula emetica]|nr:hypothetical protein F5888DRAFT_1805539 [Russula emetica]
MSYQLPRYTCWAPAGDWRRGHVILATNVDTIPSPPPRHQAAVMVDGLWGEHEWTLYPQPYCRESPYLPWLRLPSKNAPSNILTSPVHKEMWQAHPNRSNIHMVDPRAFGEFRGKLDDVKAAMMDPFHEILKDTRFPSIRLPKTAYSRAFEALDRLEMEFGAWRNFVEVVRGLQRNLLELSAFVDWWQDVQQGEDFQPPFRAPTCRAIFDDEDLYANHARWSIASYLIVPNDRFIPDPIKRVSLSPRNSSRMDVMSILPLVHSLHLWYYPPYVTDVYADFETAARGYAERLDTFHPTKGFKCTLDKLENQRADEGMVFFGSVLVTAHNASSDGRRAKKAKTTAAKMPGPSNNLELQRLYDASPPPSWYPKQQRIWDHAMKHVSHVNLKEGQSPRRFALPPIHLFWGASEQNQRTYYYHLLVLWREFLSRTQRDLPGLMTEEWRSILGNSYWKSMWPRPNPGDVRSSNFDPARFWIQGGPLFFGDELSAEVASGRDISCVLSCRCEVQLDSADDDEVRQTVLYHMEHASAEIKEMDRLQFLSDFKRHWNQGRLTAILTMTDIWGPCRDGGVKSEFYEDRKAWRAWLEAACHRRCGRDS